MTEINLPHLFTPRSYQRAFLTAMDDGARRAVLVWHRRSGKDKVALNFTAREMFKRVGTYYYFFPTYTQAQKVIWDGIDKSGQRFLDHFPVALFPKRNEVEMSIEAVNGSRFQLIGTDNIDRVVGTNPVGVVFSEYSLQNPKAWDLIRPILAENGGWAVFIYTPRGKNWGYELYQTNRYNPSWYVSKLDITMTRRDAPGEDGTPDFGKPVVGPDILAEERASGMSEELVQQEYYCSFEGALEGSFYGDLVARARVEGRIGPDFFDPTAPVDTGWDLGVDNATAVVMTQTLRGVPVIVDYLEGGLKLAPMEPQRKEGAAGLDVVARELSRLEYLWGLHFWPHDAKVTEWGTGKTRLQLAQRMGFTDTGRFGPIIVVPKISLADGIAATRSFLARAKYRDTPNVQKLLDKLIAYHREWDDETRTWGINPVHDDSSHPADAMRYRAIAYQEQIEGRLPTQALTQWHPWADTPVVQQQTHAEVEWSPFKADPDEARSPFKW
jgi:hypothetical protein